MVSASGPSWSSSELAVSSSSLRSDALPAACVAAYGLVAAISGLFTNPSPLPRCVPPYLVVTSFVSENIVTAQGGRDEQGRCALDPRSSRGPGLGGRRHCRVAERQSPSG